MFRLRRTYSRWYIPYAFLWWHYGLFTNLNLTRRGRRGFGREWNLFVHSLWKAGLVSFKCALKHSRVWYRHSFSQSIHAWTAARHCTFVETYIGTFLSLTNYINGTELFYVGPSGLTHVCSVWTRKYISRITEWLGHRHSWLQNVYGVWHYASKLSGKRLVYV